METTVLGLKTAYSVMGEGEPLLLLHGWGVERSVFAAMQEHFARYMRVWTLDFPGFGESEAPPSVWGVAEYADFVQAFCAQMWINSPVLLGHSFGGRVSITLGARGFGKKLVLTDAAGILPRRGPKYYLRVYSYKAVKRIMHLPLLNRYYDRTLERWQQRNASSDYAQAEGVMRQILVKTVNEDLAPLLPKIKLPTLLMWGENDTATPLTDGQKMEQLISGSGLVVFKGSGHYPFLEQPSYFHRVLESFFDVGQ